MVYKHKNKEYHFLWEEVEAIGTLEVHNNYPVNTHKLVTQSEIFGIKSSTLNLNDFLEDKVLVKWSISNITKDFPVIDVDSITIPDKHVKVVNNVYSFTKELLYFDFSQEKEFYAAKNGQKIIIYHQHKPVIEIEVFFCSKITPTQNCEELMQSYTSNDNEFFSSYWWNIFYKIRDNERATFNDNTLWYIIKTTDEDLLLNISHLLNIIDSSFISKNKKDFLIDNCLGDWEDSNNYSISSIKKEILDSNLVKLEIQISDMRWQVVSCKLNVDIYDNREIKNKNVQD